MIAYLKRAKAELAKFQLFDVQQIPRAENNNANALARLATSKDANLFKVVSVELLDKPTIEKVDQVAMTVDQPTTWMTPIIRYLLDAELPKEKNEAR